MAEAEISSPNQEMITVIEPSRGWLRVNFRELWDYRELLFFLSWRDISVRYKQTVMGMAWAIIQPLLSMVIFSIFFGNLAKIPSDDVPYPIFSYAALLPWQYFSSAMSASGRSMVGSGKLLTKVYFPRLIIPLAAVLPPIVDFAIAFVILIGLMIFYGVAITWRLLWLPLFLLLALATALGVGLWLSAMNVRYRDIGYVIPFLAQFWMYASPVVYPTSMLPERYQLLYGLNPMTGVIEGFRWALLGTNTPPGPITLVSAGVVVLLIISGMMYFRRMEDSFADII
ncbi:MAG: ABC transporter permease [Anaerolineae bacterium]|nr:ABC transporter permease [Anaerolineae bacterium]